jgi:methyltransferase-like protein
LTIRAVPKEVHAALAKLPLLKQQQYIDFFLNTTFRRTLLCHDHIRLERRRSGNYLDGFHIGLAGRPHSRRLDVASNNRIEVAIGRNTVASASPFAKAALQHLIDVYPGTVRIGELREAAIALLDTTADQSLGEEAATSVDDLATIVMEVYLGGAIELSLHPPRVATQISAFPVATPMARLQASAHSAVVNQLHETIELDQLTRHVLTRLDGQHDVDWLRRDLQRALEKSDIELTPNATPSLEQVLAWCRDHALLRE